MKKIGIEKSGPSTGSTNHSRHALSTKEREKAPGQQKVP